MSNKIILKHSNVINDGKAKLPDASGMTYGELAINYAKGHETISSKNSSDEIVEFPSKIYVDNVCNVVKQDVETLSQNINSLGKYNTSLNDSFIVPNSVGGISSGTTVSQLKDRPITSIIDDLLFPTINPSKKTSPSVSINLDSSTSPVELGTSAHTFTGYTFNKGKWNDSNNTDYAGTVNSVTYTAIIAGQTYTGNTISISDFPSNYSKVGNQTYKISLTYDPGDKPVNNKGQEVDGSSSGVVTASTTINVTRPYFVRLTNGTGMIEKMTSCNVSGNNATISIGKIGTIPATSALTGDDKYIFKVWGNLEKLEVDDTFSATKVTSLLDSLESETKSDGYTYYKYKPNLSKGEVTINNGTIKFSV